MSSTRAATDLTRVLVTGGTGFVGSNLVRRLLRDGHDVGLLVRARHDPWRLLDVMSDVSWIEADLNHLTVLARVIADFRPQWVFHLAAYGAYSWQSDGQAIERTNVLGTSNLLDACLRGRWLRGGPQIIGSHHRWHEQSRLGRGHKSYPVHSGGNRTVQG